MMNKYIIGDYNLAQMFIYCIIIIIYNGGIYNRIFDQDFFLARIPEIWI